MSDLTLSGVSKRYGATEALADVSLDIADGEFFTLVGPSGCGKTTTLRLVAGFETPTSGSIRFGGEDVSGVPPEDRDVGIVFQQYALFPHMSVRENVAYGLQFVDASNDPDAGVAHPDERVAELLDLVGLGGAGDRAPNELSGGQQQRVALARALAPNPDVLLLDEPMSALDARLRERLRREVRSIQRELGVTTLYVTHDQAEALAISDRVAVMNDGRVEQVGTPQEIYHRPATRFAAEFVGENNVFDGRRVDSSGFGGGRRADGEDGSRRVDGEDGQRTDGEDRSRGAGAGVETEGSVVRVEGVDFRLPPVETDRVAFCVRPEALRVDHPANAVTGTVTYAEFLGESVRIGLEWEGRTLVVRTDEMPTGRGPDGDGVAGGPDSHEADSDEPNSSEAAGEPLTVGFDPEDVVVLGESERR